MKTHRDIMVELVVGAGYRRGVEVGLGSAKLIRKLLLAAPGLQMFGVDLGLREDRKALQRQVELDFPGRCKVLWSPSVEAARKVPLRWADFIFIDAGHSYEAVKADLEAWEPRLRPGGWFGGHDYGAAFPGVKRAVDERYGRPILVGSHIWRAPYPGAKRKRRNNG